MSNIKTVQFGQKAPDGMAKALRDLADAVDRGEVTKFIGAWVQGESYCFQLDASLQDALVLATLMQTKCLDKFRA